MKYLLIKNWDLYQPDKKLKDPFASLPWVKDYTNKDFDKDYIKLTGLQRYVLDALCRIRGRQGTEVPYDMEWIIRLLHLPKRDAAHIPHALRRLIEVGFLIEEEEPEDVSAHGTIETGELPEEHTRDAQGTHTGRTKDAHGTYTVPTEVSQGTHTGRTQNAQAIFDQQNQQLPSREGEGDREGDIRDREKEGEDRLTAVVPKILKNSLQGVLSKSKAASVSDEL